MSPRVLTVEYKDNYTLLIKFTNNELKQFDLKAYINYPVYEELKDEKFCKKVKAVDGIVQWNNSIDLDPDLVYLQSDTVLLK